MNVTKFNKKEYNKQYNLNHKGTYKEYWKQYGLINKEARRQYHKQYDMLNKELVKERSRQWRLTHKDAIDEYKKQYNLIHKGAIQEHKKQYDLSHKKSNNKRKMKYVINQYKVNPNFRLSQLLRCRLYTALGVQNTVRSKRTLKLLGCTIPELKIHLESRFQPGMTWDNHGEWHIDHIRPCASFDLTDPHQQEQCFHYTNLQPLWAGDNLAKGDRFKGKL